MSIPLGGFHFNIGFQTPGARAALEALRRDALQTTEAIKAAFAGVSTGINTTQTVAAINQVTQASRAAQAAGNIRVQASVSNIAQATQQVSALSTQMQALAGQNTRLNITVNSNDLQGQIRAVSTQLDDLTKGQRATINLRLPTDQARGALVALKHDIDEATERGVIVKVQVDTQGAARDAQRLAQEQAAASKQASQSGVQSDREAAAEKRRITEELLRYNQRAYAEEQRAQRAAETAGRQQQRAQQRVAAEVNVKLDGDEQVKVSLKEIGNLANLINRQTINVKVSENASKAKAEVAALADQIAKAQSGQTIVINAQVNSKAGLAAMAQLESTIKAAEGRGVKIVANVDTTQAKSALTTLAQLGSGALRGLVAGSGAGGGLLIGAGLAGGAAVVLAAAVAAQKLTEALVGGLRSGTAYNAMLEQASQGFTLFTGGTQAAAQSLAQLRRYADVTPFNTKEVIAAGQAFAQVSAGNIGYMQRQVELAGQLAATNPSQGLEGAVRALRELQAGQVESIAERFNIPRSTIQRLKDAGLAGEELARAVVKAVGGSDALVRAYGESFAGRVSTAGSALEEFQRVASKPFFDVLSAGFAAFNKDVEANKAQWEQLAAIVGVAAGGIARSMLSIVQEVSNALKGISEFVTESKFLFDYIAEHTGASSTKAQRPGPTPGPPPLTPEQRANQSQSDQAIANLTIQQQKLSEQERALKGIEAAQKRVALMVEFTKQQYEKLLEPLERQRRLVEDQLRGAEGGLAQANDLARRSQAPVQVRASAAADTVVLEHSKELLQINQQRRQITQEIADAEAKIADTMAERGIRAAEQQLDALRRITAEHQAARREVIDGARAQEDAAKQARDVTLDGLREIVRARQEERTVVLDALREEIRGRQEARTAALEGLREEIQARRDAFQQERDASRELAEDRERAYQREEAALERTHRRRQEGFRDEIEALQRRDAEIRKQEQGPTPAERELDALEKAERERQRALSLTQAERAVREARTGRERREAIDRLRELQAQQAADRQREALQARAEQERQAREDAAAKRQEDIAALQQKAQDEDRRYQREKEARDLQHSQQQEQLQAQQREEDRQEKQRQREEDLQVRAAEKSDRELRRQEEAKIRAEEKKDRDLRKIEEAAIRSQEQANRQADVDSREKIAKMERDDREATRGEQATIRDAEAALETRRQALQQQQEARQLAADRQHLADLQASAALELQILATRERVLRAENVGGLAIAAYWKEIYQAEVDRLTFILGTIDRRIAAIKSAADAALAPYERMATELRIQSLQQGIIIERQKAIVTEAQNHLDRLGEIAKKLGEAALEQQRIAAAARDWAIALERAKAAGISPPGGTGPIDPAGPGGAQPPGGVGPVGVGADFGRWLRGKADELAAFIIQGFKSILDQDASGPIAASTWSERVIAQLTGPWQVHSPSKVTMDLANDVIDGWLIPWRERQVELELAMQAAFDSFLQPESGYMARTPAIFGTYAIDMAQAFIDEFGNSPLVETMEAPFIEVTDLYFPAALPKFGTFGQDAAVRFREGWDSGGVLEAMQAPFEAMFATYLPAYEAEWRVAGNNAMIAFANGWATPPDLITRMSNNFGALIQWFGAMDPTFVRLGENAASAFCEGWRRTMQQECPCTTCDTAPGGSGPGVGKGGGRPAPAPGRGGGGNVQSVGVFSFPAAPQVGPMLPDSMRGDLAAAAAGTGAGTSTVNHAGVSIGSLAVTVPVTIQNGESIGDPQAFAQAIADQAAEQMIQLFDHAQQTAADRSSKFLPGSL